MMCVILYSMASLLSDLCVCVVEELSPSNSDHTYTKNHICHSVYLTPRFFKYMALMSFSLFHFLILLTRAETIS